MRSWIYTVIVVYARTMVQSQFEFKSIRILVNSLSFCQLVLISRYLVLINISFGQFIVCVSKNFYTAYLHMNVQKS